MIPAVPLGTALLFDKKQRAVPTAQLNIFPQNTATHSLSLRDDQLKTPFYFSGFEIQLIPNSSTALPSWNRSLSLKPRISYGAIHGLTTSRSMGKNINFSMPLFTDPEMPARLGGDRTMNTCTPWRSHGCNLWFEVIR
jgi:hypothetical protein